MDVTGMRAVLEAATPLELLRIVAVDTWLDVLDRRKPERTGWNLLVDTTAAPARLIAIDYGLALTEVLGVPLIGAERGMQPRIPAEWAMHLHAADIDDVLADIRSVADDQIQEVVDCVPPDWSSAVPGVREVPTYLVDRRAQLEPCLGGGLNA
jgi:hypothetical protein